MQVLFLPSPALLYSNTSSKPVQGTLPHCGRRSPTVIFPIPLHSPGTLPCQGSHKHIHSTAVGQQSSFNASPTGKGGQMLCNPAGPPRKLGRFLHLSSSLERIWEQGIRGTEPQQRLLATKYRDLLWGWKKEYFSLPFPNFPTDGELQRTVPPTELPTQVLKCAQQAFLELWGN